MLSGFGRYRASLAVPFAFAAILFAGCSGEQRAAAVDAPRAREALKTVLDRWKQGDTPESLKEGSPSIVVQDADWMAGHRLVNYDVTGDGKDDNANLIIPVNLTLKSPQGREIKKSISYIVGTDPSITVFRNFP